MAFDVYNLIKSEEVREYLWKHRKFKTLEQEVIIRNSYYPIEQKLEFMKQLLTETKAEANDKEEMELLEERVRMYEFIVNFIHNPGGDVIYMSHEEVNGYDIEAYDDNDYRRSERLMPDTHYFKTFDDLMAYWDMDGRMQVVKIGIDDNWFMRHGFSEECVDDYFADRFQAPLPFGNGCRVKLHTPSMREPVFGIMDSSQDCYGCWYHFLLFENEKYSTQDLRKLLEEEYSQMQDKILQREIDTIDISYPLLELCDEYMTYDWITRAEEQNE